jgi:hypothetical protein
MKILSPILLVVLIACTDGSKKASEDAPTEQTHSDSLVIRTEKAAEIFVRPTELTQVDLSKIECVPAAYRHGDIWTAPSYTVFSEITYVYDSQNSSANITDTLAFGTPVNILAEFSDHFLVCTPKTRAGYVKKTDISLQSLPGLGGEFYYLVGLSKYGTTDQISCKRSTLKIVKASPKNNVVDTYTDSIQGNDYYIKNLYNSTLKNVKTVFYVSYNCYSEIGVSVDHLIVDNGKLSRLISGSSYGDGGSSEVTYIYLPIRLTNGKKVVLAHNGILTVNETSGKVQTYDYPKDCGIPIEDLVVVEETVEEMLWNEEKGEPLYNDDGTQAVSVTIRETIFYRWDGSKLQMVKTIKGKS